MSLPFKKRPYATSVLSTFMDEQIDQGDLLKVLAQQWLPKGDPKRLFVEWMAENKGRLKEAAEELGVFVEEGPNLLKRLEKEVTGILVDRDWEPYL